MAPITNTSNKSSTFEFSKIKLLVLAGGFGTRLRSANISQPKVLAPINGIPFIELQIQNWLRQGIRSFIFLLHHEAHKVIQFLKANENGLLKDCEIVTLVEPIPLGTGGAIAYAVKELLLQEDFYLSNADTWLTSGIGELSEVSSPAIAVVKNQNSARYGQVKFGSDQRVTAFIEKNAMIKLGWINAGLSKLSPDIFRGRINPTFSLEEDIFPRLVECGELRAVQISSNFIDIGIPEDYIKFSNWMLDNSKRLV